MAKSKRVYELAKELGTESKTLLDLLAGEGIQDKKATSTLDDNIVDLIKGKLSPADNQVRSEVKSSLGNVTPVEEKKDTEEAVDESAKEKNKIGISSSIRERMSMKKSIREKFSSRSSLKSKLDLQRSKEQVVAEEVVPEEVVQKQEVPDEIVKISADQQKKKIKDLSPQSRSDSGRPFSYQQRDSSGYQQRPGGQRDSSGYQQRPGGQRDASGYQQRPGGQRDASGYQQRPGGQRDASGYQQRPFPPRDNTGQVRTGTKDEKFFRPGQTPGSGAPASEVPVEDFPRKKVLPVKKETKTQDKRYRKEIEEEEKQLAKANLNKKKKKSDRRDEEMELEPLSTEVEVYDGMNVKELADKMRIKETDIIKSLFMKGIMVTVNQGLETSLLEKIVIENGFTVKIPEIKEEILDLKMEEMFQDENLLKTRPPVVTILGHVDHGKTSLLDSIRKTKVTAQEAGGITQHIGAYQVKEGDRLITFLDTPGHEAFTAMRARGAKVTDIAVLVVAADDGVMPQTIEAINHAKAAGVPIIVAINKIDKAGANPDRIKNQLAEYDLVAEDWGGKTVMVPVSALTKIGIDDLLEMILLTADLQDIKSNPDKLAQGVIIESKLDKGKGPVATVLIQSGTLKVGDNFVVGTISGKVRAMFSYVGVIVKEATPSTPVQVIGFPAVPSAGEIFKVMNTEKEARSAAETILLSERERLLAPSRTVSESISEKIKEGKIKELNLVIKSDVQGSSEALNQTFGKLEIGDIKTRIIHSAVGDVSETDVSLAAASEAVLIAFNVKVDNNAKEIAEKEHVEIKNYNIIYKALEDIEKIMEGLIEPEYEEVLSGKVTVRAVFTIGKNAVAGSYVTEGKILRGSIVKVFRGGKLLNTGKLSTLKRFKDDVKEVSTGYECGISVDNFNDFQVDDVIECYSLQPKSR